MNMGIGFVLFPNLTQLDFTGPLQVLHRLPGSSKGFSRTLRATCGATREHSLLT